VIDFCGPHHFTAGERLATYIDRCLINGHSPHQVEHMVSTRWARPAKALLRDGWVDLCDEDCAFQEVLYLLLRAQKLAAAAEAEREAAGGLTAEDLR
jgi:hypothetical protein